MKSPYPGLALVLVWLVTASASLASTVELIPAADAGLVEGSPNNNAGGHSDMAVGTTEHASEMRGLMRFDFEGKIPKGSVITSATLKFDVTRIPLDGGSPSTVNFHHLFAAWEEGTKTGNIGGPATEGEVTWNSARHGIALWSAPGATLGDYDPTVVASVEIDKIGTYTIPTSPALAFTVQNWLESPEINRGFILISAQEGTPGTARRIATRESGAKAPRLTLEFTPPDPPFRIIEVKLQQDSVTLDWSGGEPVFQVQSQVSIDSPWTSVGEPTSERKQTFTRSGAAAFYRVVGDFTARYRVEFAATWSQATHPSNWPADARWSPLVGAVHHFGSSLWEEGKSASPGIQQMAESGATSQLLSEVAAVDAKNGSVLTPLLDMTLEPFPSPGVRTLLYEGPDTQTFPINRDFPLVTLVSMVAPSPDWFVGVSGLALLENDQWVGNKVVDLFPFDAGTDSGVSYDSANLPTEPRSVISRITGFPTLVNGELVPFGKLTFTRVDETE